MKKITLITIAGIIAGIIGGWLYWKYRGCDGSCLITSKPVNSMLYGGVLGGLLFNVISSLFVKNRKQSS